MSSEQAAGLAADYQAAADEVVEFVRSCSDQQWACRSEVEGWTVGAICNHIADGYVGIRGWLQSCLEGTPAEGVADIHTTNAERSEVNSARGREETITRLEHNSAPMRELIAGLSDEQLAISFPFGSVPEMKASGLAKLATRHATGHLANARAAAEPRPEVSA